MRLCFLCWMLFFVKEKYNIKPWNRVVIMNLWNLKSNYSHAYKRSRWTPKYFYYLVGSSMLQQDFHDHQTCLLLTHLHLLLYHPKASFCLGPQGMEYREQWRASDFVPLNPGTSQDHWLALAVRKTTEGLFYYLHSHQMLLWMLMKGSCSKLKKTGEKAEGKGK